LLYRLLCCLVGVLARGGGERELEIVVLRHQLAILRRGGKRPQYTTVDQALLAAVSRLVGFANSACRVKIGGFAGRIGSCELTGQRVGEGCLDRWSKGALISAGLRRRRA
jgi:hypothetical protein